MNKRCAARTVATSVVVDACVLNVVLASVLLISGLVLILSSRAEWLYAT